MHGNKETNSPESTEEEGPEFEFLGECEFEDSEWVTLHTFSIERTGGVDEKLSTDPEEEPTNEEAVENWWNQNNTVDISDEISRGLQDSDKKFDLLATTAEADTRDDEPCNGTVGGILVLFLSLFTLLFSRKEGVSVCESSAGGLLDLV